MAQFDLQNFTNIDSEKFIGKWAGEGYSFEIGETRAFPIFLVDHFCKHLADKILMRTDEFSNDAKRAELYAQMKGGQVIPAEKPEKEKTEGEILKEQIEMAQKSLIEEENIKKEAIRQKRIEILKKAREIRKQKQK